VLYLLDANVLITANRLYYPLERVPEFWEWLVHMGRNGQIKVPVEQIEEIVDELSDWLDQDDRRGALQLDENADVALVQQVINEGYAVDLNDEEIEIIGRDPFLIAAAMRSPGDRRVVTVEVSKPKRQRANRHIPDVCASVGIECIDTFALLRDLDFSTAWRSRL